MSGSERRVEGRDDQMACSQCGFGETSDRVGGVEGLSIKDRFDGILRAGSQTQRQRPLANSAELHAEPRFGSPAAGLPYTVGSDRASVH